MSTDTHSLETQIAGWRIKLGAALFGISIVLPVAGIPLVTTLGLSTKMTATVSGGLLVGAEVLGVCAIAVMGKKGVPSLKTWFSVFLSSMAHPVKSVAIVTTLGY